MTTHLTDEELELCHLRRALCESRSTGEALVARVETLEGHCRALQAQTEGLQVQLAALARATRWAVEATLSHCTTFLSKLRAAQAARALADKALEAVVLQGENGRHG